MFSLPGTEATAKLQEVKKVQSELAQTTDLVQSTVAQVVVPTVPVPTARGEDSPNEAHLPTSLCLSGEKIRRMRPTCRHLMFVRGENSPNEARLPTSGLSALSSSSAASPGRLARAAPVTTKSEG
jgi:hypothetical protein